MGKKMADDNEDQWLYGDSAEGKDYTPTNIQSSESHQNESVLTKLAEKSQAPEDQKMESSNEIPSEVHASHNLYQTFILNCFLTKHLIDFKFCESNTLDFLYCVQSSSYLHVLLSSITYLYF